MGLKLNQMDHGLQPVSAHKDVNTKRCGSVATWKIVNKLIYIMMILNALAKLLSGIKLASLNTDGCSQTQKGMACANEGVVECKTGS